MFQRLFDPCPDEHPGFILPKSRHVVDRNRSSIFKGTWLDSEVWHGQGLFCSRFNWLGVGLDICFTIFCSRNFIVARRGYYAYLVQRIKNTVRKMEGIITSSV